MTINELSNSGLLSSTIFKNNNVEGLKFKEHNNYFKYYCRICHLNLYDKCKKGHDFVYKCIELESMKIDNELDKIIAIINSKNINNLNTNENNIKLFQIDDTHFEKVNEEEEERFNKLIRIIISEFKIFKIIHIF